MSTKFFTFFLSIFLLLGVISCDMLPAPDKVIKIELMIDESLQSNSEIDNVIEILKKRISEVSKTYKIKRKGDKNLINVEVATHCASDRIKNLVTNQGKLGFYEMYNIGEMKSFITHINDLLKKDKEKDSVPFNRLMSSHIPYNSLLFNVSEKDTALLNSYVLLNEIEGSLPVERQFVRFVWGIKEKSTDNFPFYALKLNKHTNPVIDGKVIEQVYQGFDHINDPMISIEMNSEGAEAWENLTGKTFKEGGQIAMVINDVVYSAPKVGNGPIKGGRSEISGGLDLEQAKDFANILSSGEIPKMKLVHFEVQKLQ